MTKKIFIEDNDIASVEHMLESLAAASILLDRPKKINLTPTERAVLKGSISMGKDLFDKMTAK
jgi:hypothetical protein